MAKRCKPETGKKAERSEKTLRGERPIHVAQVQAIHRRRFPPSVIDALSHDYFHGEHIPCDVYRHKRRRETRRPRVWETNGIQWLRNPVPRVY